MVKHLEVTELMHHHVVKNFVGGEHEPPIECEHATCRAGAPKRALASDPDPLKGDADLARFFVGHGGDQLASRNPALRLTDQQMLKAECRNLGASLPLDPLSLCSQDPSHLTLTHPHGHRQPRWRSPRDL